MKMGTIIQILVDYVIPTPRAGYLDYILPGFVTLTLRSTVFILVFSMFLSNTIWVIYRLEAFDIPFLL
jgi:hypothetical protein